MDDGGVSWVFSSCGASVGCLMKYHGDLREPLVCCDLAARPEEAFREPATLAAKVPASLRPRRVLLSLKIVLAGYLGW